MMYLYVLYDGSYYKIGVSNDPYKRRNTCQTGNPNFIELIAVVNCLNSQYARWLESHLHSYFCRYRKRGEWFRDLSHELFIEALDTAKQKLRGPEFEPFRSKLTLPDTRMWPHYFQRLTEAHADWHSRGKP